MLAEPGFGRFFDNVVDGDSAVVHLSGGPVAEDEPHRFEDCSAARLWRRLAGDEQSLVDVVMQHASADLDVRPAECDGYRLHDAVADGVRMSQPFAFHVLRPP